MRMLARHDFWEHQRKVGLSLRAGYEGMVRRLGLEEHTRIIGMPHFTSIQWPDPNQFTLFQQEMMREGILFTGSQFPCLAHTDEQVMRTRYAYDAAGAVVADAIKAGDVVTRLECLVNQSIFQRHR